MLHINMMSKTITTLLAALLILLSTINPTAAAPLANTNQLPNLNTTAVIIPSDPDAITIASTSFGAAIDLCRDTYYGDCFLNVIVPDLQCYFLNPNYFSGRAGLSSIKFFGHMYCILYEGFNCDGRSVQVNHAEADLNAVDGNPFNNFNDMTMGIKCHRND